jgi:hypothetical protein
MKPVFNRLSRSDEVEEHPTLVRALIEHPRGELRAVIYGDRSGPTVLGNCSIECVCDRASRHTLSHLQDRTPATPLIDDGEDAKRFTVGERITD